jgi:hypothetical protein
MSGAVPPTGPSCPKVDAVPVTSPSATLGAEVQEYAVPFYNPAAARGAGLLEPGLPKYRLAYTFEPRRGGNQFGGFGGSP